MTDFSKSSYLLDQAPPWINLLVYAEPGAGKTTLAATANFHTEMQELLFVNVEGGLLTVKQMHLSPSPRVVEVRSSGQLEALYHALRKKEDPFEKVRTVIIDSGSEFFTQDLEAAVRESIGREGDTTDAKKKAHLSADDVWLDDRGLAGRRVARLFRWYRDLPMNVIITAHVREEFAEQSRNDRTPRSQRVPVDVSPELPPKLCGHVKGYMDFVWLLRRMDEDSVGVLTQKAGPFYAKTRGDITAKTIGGRFVWKRGDPLLADLYQFLHTGENWPEDKYKKMETT